MLKPLTSVNLAFPTLSVIAPLFLDLHAWFLKPLTIHPTVLSLYLTITDHPLQSSL